jgi:uncharacterized protein (DUF2267 family)
MSVTGLDVFDSTLNVTHIWLNEIMEERGIADKHAAYLALRATLQALRDRLNVDEAAQLGAQLPMLVRGFYYEGWNPSKTPTKERHIEQFLAHVERNFGGTTNLKAEDAARAVFALLDRKVSAGEIDDIVAALPEELLELWP